MMLSLVRIRGLLQTLLAVLVLSFAPGVAQADDEFKAAQQSAMAGLKKFQYLIGSWRGTTQTGGPKRTGMVEDIRWRWQITKEELPALRMEVTDGQYFRMALLKYDADRDRYLLTAQRVLDGEDAANKDAKTENVIYEGKYEPSEEDPSVNVLNLSRRIPGSSAQERVTLRLQEQYHYVFQLDKRATSRAPFRPIKVFSVTREGESIAKVDEGPKGPICIVSGGLGTSSINYKGQTYYFCCSGCSESFKDDPERWIAEAAKKAKSAEPK